MRTILYEDDGWRRLLPLTALRSVHQLRCGALPLWEKARALLGGALDGLACRPGIADLWEGEPCPVPLDPAGTEDTLWLNARVLWTPELHQRAADLGEWQALTGTDGTRLAVRMKADASAPDLLELFSDARDGGTLEARVLETWVDLLTEVPGQIREDARVLGRDLSGTVPEGVAVQGEGGVWIGEGAILDPGVVLDTREGPVLVDEGARIMAGAFLQGPCWIGPGSIVKAHAVLYAGCSIGPHCRVGGELAAVSMQGWSNKQHEGYLGNAAVGAWVNLGAGTSNSDLKNTYGPITVSAGGEMLATGRIHLGACLGDHTKTAINTSLNTGTVTGVGCNLFGAGFHPVTVPDFVWGQPGDYKEHIIAKMLETARAAMGRRDVTLTPALESALQELFEATSRERGQFLIKKANRRSTG